MIYTYKQQIIFCEFLGIEITEIPSLSDQLWGERQGNETWNGKDIRGRKLSEEEKMLLSVSLTGRKLTEEHKRNIGKANKISRRGIVPWNKGRKIDTTNYRKTVCNVMHPDGTLEHVTCMKDFCESHGLSKSNMSLVARGIQSHHRGYKVII